MKTSLRLALFASLGLISLSGFAASKQPATVPSHYQSFYGGLHGGGAFPMGGLGSKMRFGFNAGAQLGIEFNSNVRAELAATYLRHTYHHGVFGALNAGALLGNVYYSYPLAGGWIPFVGLGMGFLHENIPAGVSRFDNAQTGGNNEFAYQAMVGIDYRFQSNMTIGLRYQILSWTNDDVYENLATVVINYYV